MEYFFTATYRGIEARLIFQSLGLAHTAKNILTSKGVVCSETKPVLADIHRDFAEIERAKRFIAFSRT